MARQQTTAPATRAQAVVESAAAGDTTLVNLSGLVDERFTGFGDLATAKTIVLNVTNMTRMTSFGVRQWLKAMDALPKASQVYLLGCPTFLVDQLNMVLNFGGSSKVLTVCAPYTCTSCGVESAEVIDVFGEASNLAKGTVPEKECKRCGNKLEFDETPESYFAFASKYGATALPPSTAQVLSQMGLYQSQDTGAEKPPKIIKLVHGAVTYFRISGTVGSMFRARPFLVGAEGEVVIDLAEVDRFEPAGQNEWRRLLKNLSTQVPSVTLVDVTESCLSVMGNTLAGAKTISVASVLVPYGCAECGTSYKSISLENQPWPPQFGTRVCPTCGGPTRSQLSSDSLAPLQKASTEIPPASAKVIAQREELLSRAMTDAKVAQAGDQAVADIGADDTILGKYKIVRRLSEGGMAEVFLAKQVGIGGFEKPVALKRIQRKLLDSRQQAIDMFLNEAKIAGRLMHPNIVQVLDVGEVAGALYLAMEYVHGKDLRDLLKKLKADRQILPLGEACYMVREVAQALHHAYWSTDMDGKRLNVVHRDVSPQNVIISYDGTVKLLDFGVAMSAVTEHAESLIVGKWLYMSPEATRQQPIDHRSDLFSLGVILYYLCCGQMPFAGREPKEIVKKIRAGDHVMLAQAAPHVPPRLASLVERLLAVNPDDRPQTGQEVVSELTEIARENGIESSSAAISQLLQRVFPEVQQSFANEESTDVNPVYVDDNQKTIVATPSVPNPPTPTPPSPAPPPAPLATATAPAPAPAERQRISTGAVPQLRAWSPAKAGIVALLIVIAIGIIAFAATRG